VEEGKLETPREPSGCYQAGQVSFKFSFSRDNPYVLTEAKKALFREIYEGSFSNFGFMFCLDT